MQARSPKNRIQKKQEASKRTVLRDQIVIPMQRITARQYRSEESNPCPILAPGDLKNKTQAKETEEAVCTNVAPSGQTQFLPD